MSFNDQTFVIDFIELCTLSQMFPKMFKHREISILIKLTAPIKLKFWVFSTFASGVESAHWWRWRSEEPPLWIMLKIWIFAIFLSCWLGRPIGQLPLSKTEGGSHEVDHRNSFKSLTATRWLAHEIDHSDHLFGCRSEVQKNCFVNFEKEL